MHVVGHSRFEEFLQESAWVFLIFELQFKLLNQVTLNLVFVFNEANDRHRPRLYAWIKIRSVDVWIAQHLRIPPVGGEGVSDETLAPVSPLHKASVVRGLFCRISPVVCPVGGRIVQSKRGIVGPSIINYGGVRRCLPLLRDRFIDKNKAKQNSESHFHERTSRRALPADVILAHQSWIVSAKVVLVWLVLHLN